MDQTEAMTRLLDAAERLFYERGIRSVSMDEIRAASGVSLKRLYQCFSSKEELVLAALRRRDERWRASLADSVAQHTPGTVERVLAVFDWLGAWFREPGFRGCAFANSVGELGASSPAVTEIAQQHKQALNKHLAQLVHESAVHDPDETTEQLQLLVEGAITTAAITGDAEAARHARQAAARLLGTTTGTR
ncbi:TetR/AcrR family transcriptional regulator [Parasphingorhabdus pacifica]